ncbi:MAG: hypothetical protein QQN62_07515, partial [Nitrosopumilus sp.]
MSTQSQASTSTQTHASTSTQTHASTSTQTHASTSTQTHAINVYSIYTQNVQKYFENISKITPQYFQSITQLQEECMKTCEKTIN